MARLRYFVAMLLLLGCTATGARAQSAPTAESLFAALKSANPGLQDYQANIHIVLTVVFGVPVPVTLNLDGKYYYKRPDHYKLVVEHAPDFVQKYPQIFGYNLPKLEDYNARVGDVETVGGISCYHVYLSARHAMGDILGQELWIDKANGLLPKQITHYKDGGQIAVTVTYMVQGAYHLLDKVDASFNFPKIHTSATADASYSNYQPNQKLPDSFFSPSP